MAEAVSLYSPRARTERLIAVSRTILAGGSLLALWLDPVEPIRHAQTAYVLLAAYLAYSVVVAAVTLTWGVGGRVWHLGSHAFDLGFFTLFVYFTAGPSSPFFAFFVFSLVCASSRWQWPGTLWTAGIALAALFALGWYFGRIVHDPDYELYTFIIRAVYLAVIALLLGYLGAHEARTRREISTLAGFTGTTTDSEEALVEDLLHYAARVLQAPRALLAWSAEGRPFRVVEGRRDPAGGMSCGRVPELEEGALEVETLRAEDFLCADLRARQPTLYVAGRGAERRWRGPVLTPGAGSTLAAQSVLACRLGGERVSGRLFFLDKRGMTEDDVVLAAVVRRTVTAALDRHYLNERVKETVADEERVRLARDLHDGVLQSMTGFGLRLAAIRGQLGEGSGAGETLDELQTLMSLEQRDLRFFIQELHAPTPDASGGRELRERLEDLADRIEGEWGLDVELEIAPEVEGIGGRLGREVYHLVREGMVNAARHATAGRVTVRLAAAADPDRLDIRVRDDGRGFPFHGRFTGEALAAARLGPRSLRERIAALGGSLVVESEPTGSCLEILLPASP